MHCFKLVVPSFMNERDTVKGYGLQSWYGGWNDSYLEESVFARDGIYRNSNDRFNVAISLWMLDDLKEENGTLP